MRGESGGERGGSTLEAAREPGVLSQKGDDLEGGGGATEDELGFLDNLPSAGRPIARAGDATLLPQGGQARDPLLRKGEGGGDEKSEASKRVRFSVRTPREVRSKGRRGKGPDVRRESRGTKGCRSSTS